MAQKKLTRAQSTAWEAIKYLVSQNKGYWNGYRAVSGGVIRGAPKASAPFRTLQGIERAGLIKLERAMLYGESKEFTLTDAGKAEMGQPADIAALDAPAAEPDIIDRLLALAEQHDDSLIVPLQKMYERYENHPVLQWQLAEQIDHAAILVEERARLMALVERCMELVALVNDDGMTEAIAGHLAKDWSEAGLERYGDWYCLLDDEVGLLAEYNQTGQYAEQIDHAAALVADRQRLLAALEDIKDLPDSADFLTAWSIAVAALRGDEQPMLDVMLNAEEG